MKKSILLLLFILGALITVKSQEVQKEPTITVYCQVECFEYRPFYNAINARVDFGVTDSIGYAYGLIRNPDNNKAISFESRMGVFTYMTKRGWKYIETTLIYDKDRSTPGMYLLFSKEMPADCTPEDIVRGIDFRKK